MSVSDLMPGDNVIELLLTASGQSNVTVTFRISGTTYHACTLNFLKWCTTGPAPQFEVMCSVDFYNATTILVDCRPTEGSEEISGIQSYMIGGVNQGSGI